MRNRPAASTSSVASASAAATSLTPSPVPSEPVPLICSVISAAFLCADRSQLGRLDAVRGFQITFGRFPFWQPRTKSSWRTGPLPASFSYRSSWSPLRASPGGGSVRTWAAAFDTRSSSARLHGGVPLVAAASEVCRYHRVCWWVQVRSRRGPSPYGQVLRTQHRRRLVCRTGALCSGSGRRFARDHWRVSFPADSVWIGTVARQACSNRGMTWFRSPVALTAAPWPEAAL